jgi:hypothetical protein
MVMHSRILAVSALIALAVAAGCASILSIPDRQAEWCDRPENAHAFCDDFDHTDAGGLWATNATPGASARFVGSSDTAPNAVDLSTAALALGAPTVVGMFRQFTGAFGHVRVALDVRFIQVDLAAEGGLASEVGFLLLEQQGFCLGAVLTPDGVGLVMRARSTDCTSVVDLPVGARSIKDDAGLPVYTNVGPVPAMNQWLHFILDVKRKPDGSGAVAFSFNYPGVLPPPQIPAGMLNETAPAVAVATSVVGPTGRVELQFDNVTVDFPAD